MKFFDTVLARLAPYDCLVCGDEGALLCSTCVPLLGAPVPSRCFRCQKLTDDFGVCETCRSSVALGHVWMKYVYKDTAKALIKEFKFNGKRGGARELAALLAPGHPNLPHAVLVHIPTATQHIRERGYDHAQLLAKALAAQTGQLHLPLLARTSQQRQLGAGRTERLANIAGSFRVNGTETLLKGAHIILVDDVVTTGATLSEAAKVLRAAGAAHVDAVIFAQTIL